MSTSASDDLKSQPSSGSCSDSASSGAIPGSSTSGGEASIGPKETVTAKGVVDYLLFGLSLPERTVRATAALVGGTLTETTQLLVPRAFRSSKTYSIFVQQMLDLMTKKIGRVEGEKNAEGSAVDAEGYVARKTVGNFVELAGLATIHLSPLTILAIVSDVAYGSNTYLKELAEELHREGVIDETSSIHNVNDFLAAIQGATGKTAEAFDLPPMSLKALSETIVQTRDAVGKIDPTAIIPKSEIDQLWRNMESVAKKEHASLFEVASTMTLMTIDSLGYAGTTTLSAVRVATNILERDVLNHYVDSLEVIQKKGLFPALADVSKPYISAVWTNFSANNETLTEDLVSGRAITRFWNGVQNWFVPKKVEVQDNIKKD